MPKVTLLGKAGRYDIVVGDEKYVFNAGVQRIVPAHVGSIAQRVRDHKGKNRFLVEDMPTKPTAVQKQTCQAPDQNEPAIQHRQRVFERWPSELM